MLLLLLQCEQRPSRPLQNHRVDGRKMKIERFLAIDWSKTQSNRPKKRRTREKKMIAFLFMNFDGHMASFRFINIYAWMLNVNIESNWYLRRFIPYGETNHCGTMHGHERSPKLFISIFSSSRSFFESLSLSLIKLFRCDFPLRALSKLQLCWKVCFQRFWSICDLIFCLFVLSPHQLANKIVWKHLHGTTIELSNFE